VCGEDRFELFLSIASFMFVSYYSLCIHQALPEKQHDQKRYFIFFLFSFFRSASEKTKTD